MHRLGAKINREYDLLKNLRHISCKFLEDFIIQLSKDQVSILKTDPESLIHQIIDCKLGFFYHSVRLYCYMKVNNRGRNMFGFMISFHDHKFTKEKKKISYFFSYKKYLFLRLSAFAEREQRIWRWRRWVNTQLYLLFFILFRSKVWSSSLAVKALWSGNPS